MKIKVYAEDMYWFTRNEIRIRVIDFKNLIKRIIGLIKEMFTIKNYFYIILFTILLVMIKNPKNRMVFWLIIAISLIFYRRHKTGEHIAYMRSKKGYSVHVKEIKKDSQKEENK